MTLNIITIEEYPDGALRRVAEAVKFPLSQEDHVFIQAMKDKVCALGGVGLAANQVNVLKQVAVIYIPKEAAQLRDNVQPCDVYALINPHYWPHGDPLVKVKDFEGCYSVKSIMGEVPRHPSIRVRYQKEDGSTVDRIVEGFEARVLQHEIDHLNGVLFSDLFTPDCRRGDHASIMKLRRDEMPEEKRAVLDQLMKEGKSLGDD